MIVQVGTKKIMVPRMAKVVVTNLAVLILVAMFVIKIGEQKVKSPVQKASGR